MHHTRALWSFLNFNHHNSNQIDELIKNDASIEELMDDENILGEFKSLNDKLLD